MLLDFIRQWEGFSPVRYRCPAGYQTVGYGHLVQAGRWYDEPLSLAAAEELLAEDVAKAEAALSRLVRVPLLEHQRWALVSFTFNLGAGALERSTMRRKLNRGEYAAVPNELRRWVFAGGKKLPGLVRRREAEARVFVNGLA